MYFIGVEVIQSIFNTTLTFIFVIQVLIIINFLMTICQQHICLNIEIKQLNFPY